MAKIKKENGGQGSSLKGPPWAGKFSRLTRKMTPLPFGLLMASMEPEKGFDGVAIHPARYLPGGLLVMEAASPSLPVTFGMSAAPVDAPGALPAALSAVSAAPRPQATRSSAAERAR